MSAISGTIVKFLGQEEEIEVNKNNSAEDASKEGKDGSVQFRLDADKLEALNKVAAQKRTGAGVLARMWVIERLEKETGGKVAGIEPMELVADSMKALAGVLGVQNVTTQINERLDQLEKKLQHVNLPRLKEIKTTAKGSKAKATKTTKSASKTTKAKKASGKAKAPAKSNS
ncbi:MAG: hypothetical protein K2X29_12340 [Candidatus Obscuribacterales bacterium]|nr:hypothetical protein [Candidatus Obscuribacterales bacterium]